MTKEMNGTTEVFYDDSDKDHAELEARQERRERRKHERMPLKSVATASKGVLNDFTAKKATEVVAFGNNVIERYKNGKATEHEVSAAISLVRFWKARKMAEINKVDKVLNWKLVA